MSVDCSTGIICFFLLLSFHAGAAMEKPGVGYTIEKFTISRDDSLYECFPSLARCKNGRIILT